ncbi:phosphoserine phosphatase SerB [Arthrobacter roseus]|uniref:phosphoserine phosphatase SerB n=1 Tax=Arthrobacter roseus TaxID=136274 RepID=UPI001EF75955|nr:phosphoserine phosphatase SerB [Arthrobacter roseus]MBM7848519.1 phosphoserine phosphatase [Arthrobacter roseus]
MNNPAAADFAVICYGPQIEANHLSSIQCTVEKLGASLMQTTSGGGDAYVTERMLFRAAQPNLFDIRRAVNTALAARTVAAPQVGAAVVPPALLEHTRKLLVMDVDSTLIKQEVIELLAVYAGREAEVAAITDAAMRGELDFRQSLHQRVAALAGLPESVFETVAKHIELSDGAEVLINAFLTAGHAVAVVSGGFTQILEPLVKRLRLTYSRANVLGVSGGKLTGTVEGIVVDRAVKERLLRSWAAEIGVAMEHTIAIGDGANDLDMLAAAGLGVAFNAKPVVRAAATCTIDVPQLDIVRHFVEL